MICPEPYLRQIFVADCRRFQVTWPRQSTSTNSVTTCDNRGKKAILALFLGGARQREAPRTPRLYRRGAISPITHTRRTTGLTGCSRICSCKIHFQSLKLAFRQNSEHFPSFLHAKAAPSTRISQLRYRSQAVVLCSTLLSHCDNPSPKGEEGLAIH
jgi:hypothetical protein